MIKDSEGILECRWENKNIFGKMGGNLMEHKLLAISIKIKNKKSHGGSYFDRNIPKELTMWKLNK